MLYCLHWVTANGETIDDNFRLDAMDKDAKHYVRSFIRHLKHQGGHSFRLVCVRKLDF